MIGIQVFFLVGPSGAGKSLVARWLEKLDFLHLDVDQHHGFKANGLRHEWHEFSSRSDARPLVEALVQRAVTAGKSGVFLSLPSTRILSRKQVELAQQCGIKTVLLWGSTEWCQSARRSRDEGEGRQFDRRRYNRSNANAFRVYGAAEFDDVRISVFDSDGARRSRQEIMAEIDDSLANLTNTLQPTAPGAIRSRG